MKSKKIKWTMAGTVAAAAFCANSVAQSSDALLDKLVQKGVLTAEEAKDLRNETKKDFDKSYASKSGLSPWVSALRFNGDFRARYDGVYQDDSNSGPGTAREDRHRLRYRLRFG